MYPIHWQWIMEMEEEIVKLAQELGKTVEQVTAEIEASCEEIEAEAPCSAGLVSYFFSPVSVSLREPSESSPPRSNFSLVIRRLA